MAWDYLKRIFGRRRKGDAKNPEIPWLAAADNRWGVPVLDVRPLTQTVTSWSLDKEEAANAISFGHDDGTSFIGQEPPVARNIAASLWFPIDRLLADGVLFTPREMEHKWALFHHRGKMICVRSWQRQVQAVAQVEARGSHAEITAIRGTFATADEKPAFTIRVLDYLLRSHALGLVYPAPLPPGMDADPKAAAHWCMSAFGNLAWVATARELPRTEPDEPLRTDSLLHIAVARGDIPAIEARLAAGIPIDLLARDGLAPLHWALAAHNPAIMGLLLERGSSPDVRSYQGATPLMNAVQGRNLEQAAFLLDHGADPNARDGRGFTALHRAAEMGEIVIARLLLDRGAAVNPEADGGQTPRSLAEARGETAVVALLNEKGA